MQGHNMYSMKTSIFLSCKEMNQNTFFNAGMKVFFHVGDEFVYRYKIQSAMHSTGP